jgi:hypothetical protein
VKSAPRARSPARASGARSPARASGARSPAKYALYGDYHRPKKNATAAEYALYGDYRDMGGFDALITYAEIKRVAKKQGIPMEPESYYAKRSNTKGRKGPDWSASGMPDGVEAIGLDGYVWEAYKGRWIHLKRSGYLIKDEPRDSRR